MRIPENFLVNGISNNPFFMYSLRFWVEVLSEFGNRILWSSDPLLQADLPEIKTDDLLCLS